MNQTYKYRFIQSAAVIYAVSGSAKMIGAYGDAKILTVADPILGLQFGHLMFLAGALELTIAGACFSRRRQYQAALMVAWLATNLFAYRLGLRWIGWHHPCPCLGNLTDALHVSPQIADTAMKIILAYLLLGSYSTLFWFWRQRKKAIPVPSKD